MLKRFTLLQLAILAFATTICFASDKKPKRPNIIFMMSDDHAYQAISAYGYGLNNTPNIDRLAKEGAIFKKAFVANSICAPSRATMLTGKHSYKNGMLDNREGYDWNQDNFAKQLQSNGYQTALIGKIHLAGLPQGFNYSNVLPGQGSYYNPDFIENGKKKRYQGYVSTITTDIALDWLKEKRDQDKPFMLICNQKAPHRNWQPEGKYLTLYDDKDFTPPVNFFDDYSGRGTAAKEQDMTIHKTMTPRDLKIVSHISRFSEEQKAVWNAAYQPKNDAFKKANLTGKELDIWKFNRYIKDYLRCIKSVDDGVGRVLDYLDENGLAENTIVIYTSDQGFYLGEHGWFDKRFMYEESFRTPLLMRYPKEIKAGSQIDEMVQNIDFAPTLLDYADTNIPQDIQGESFREVVNSGKARNWRDAIYYTYYEYPLAPHYVKRHYGVRTDRYKLIHFYYDIDEWEMYDLEKDPSEMKSVYDDPAYAKIQEDMHEKLLKIRKKYGDSDEQDQRLLKEYLGKYTKMK